MQAVSDRPKKTQQSPQPAPHVWPDLTCVPLLAQGGPMQLLKAENDVATTQLTLLPGVGDGVAEAEDDIAAQLLPRKSQEGHVPDAGPFALPVAHTPVDTHQPQADNAVHTEQLAITTGTAS